MLPVSARVVLFYIFFCTLHFKDHFQPRCAPLECPLIYSTERQSRARTVHVRTVTSASTVRQCTTTTAVRKTPRDCASLPIWEVGDNSVYSLNNKFTFIGFYKNLAEKTVIRWSNVSSRTIFSSTVFSYECSISIRIFHKIFLESSIFNVSVAGFELCLVWSVIIVA